MKRKFVCTIASSVILVSLSVGTAFAQIKQGGWMAGGSLGLNFGTNQYERPGSSQNTTIITETRYSQFNFSPKIGYFLTESIALGLNVNLGTTTNKDKDGDERSTTSSYTVGVFGRYYFPMKLFIETEAGIGKQKTDGDTKNNLFTYSIGAGYAAFLNDNVALE